MIKLTKDNILTLYKIMVDNTGGTIGIRDTSLLESALNAPFQTFGDEELYPSIIEKASRLCYGLIKNHPFIDGNKRIGVYAMLVFLELNNLNLNFSDEEVINIALKTADSTYSYEDILGILKRKSWDLLSFFFYKFINNFTKDAFIIYHAVIIFHNFFV